MEANKLLLEAGYKNWKTEPIEFEIQTKHYQRRVGSNETEAVCECNDRLHINISQTQHRDYPESYEMNIRAERNSRWCDLKLYSLSKEDIEANLGTMEKMLIKMFNAL